jgi:hypothetical protein
VTNQENLPSPDIRTCPGQHYRTNNKPEVRDL